MENNTLHSAAHDPLEILLVEDNPGDIRLVQEAIKTTNYDINHNVVTDGNTAVEVLLQTEPKDSLPDLVLLDLNLPGRDGCAVLNAIREDSIVQMLPVLMLSSSSTEADIARCYEAEANAYLTKPSTLHELCEIMKEVEEFWFEKAHLPPDLG